MIGPDVDETWNQSGSSSPRSPAAIFHGTRMHSTATPTRWTPDSPAGSRSQKQRSPMEPCGSRAQDGTSRGLQPHVWSKEHNEWQCQFDGEAEPKEKFAVELEPGQILVFSRLVPHASGRPTLPTVPGMAYQVGYVPPGIVSLHRTARHSETGCRCCGGGKAVLREDANRRLAFPSTLKLSCIPSPPTPPPPTFRAGRDFRLDRPLTPLYNGSLGYSERTLGQLHQYHDHGELIHSTVTLSPSRLSMYVLPFPSAWSSTLTNG